MTQQLHSPATTSTTQQAKLETRIAEVNRLITAQFDGWLTKTKSSYGCAKFDLAIPRLVPAETTAADLALLEILIDQTVASATASASAAIAISHAAKAVAKHQRTMLRVVRDPARAPTVTSVINEALAVKEASAAEALVRIATFIAHYHTTMAKLIPHRTISSHRGRIAMAASLRADQAAVVAEAADSISVYELAILNVTRGTEATRAARIVAETSAINETAILVNHTAVDIVNNLLALPWIPDPGVWISEIWTWISGICTWTFDQLRHCRTTRAEYSEGKLKIG